MRKKPEFQKVFFDIMQKIPFEASVGFGRVMRLESDNINIPIWEKAMVAQIVI